MKKLAIYLILLPLHFL
uniref:Uncharacterized protein n=1 Tax=Arundo donax TaxID=35708 RepID=A0A0A9EAR9_ARUDO